LPLYKNKDVISTEFTMSEIEELGLLKMDFLGLKNLVVIKDSIALIKKNHNENIDFSNENYSNKKAYKIIAQGNTEGLFQLESPGMTSFMTELKPTSIEDLTAGIALFRPGPMDFIPMYVDGKHNAKKVKYDHKKLEPILNVTYGCIVYQEQVMQIARELAGYSFAQSDVIRKAMGKKKHNILMKERNKFIYGDEEENIKGCINNGIPEEIAVSLWDKLEKFGSYAFNKSHSAAYAVISYMTAFLKANYKEEFMAALMSSAMGDVKKIKRYIQNANTMNIEVLPPSVLESEYRFTVVDGKIRFALGSLKGVGENAVNEILAKRKQYESGKIKKPESFQEFIEGLDLGKVNKTVIETLIQSGATEVFSGHRFQHYAVYPLIVEQIKNNEKEKNKQAVGQSTLFNISSEFSTIANKTFELPKVSTSNKEFQLEKEKEISGVYLSGHPMKDNANIIEKIKSVKSSYWDYKNKVHREVRFIYAKDVEKNEKANTELNDIDFEFYDNDPVRIAIYLTEIKTIMTKKGDSMCVLTGEDETGFFEIVVFPKLYKKILSILEVNKTYIIMGNLDLKTETPKILAQKLTIISEVEKYINKNTA
jgi:DNA polymerase-3 subunit alpha